MTESIPGTPDFAPSSETREATSDKPGGYVWQGKSALVIGCGYLGAQLLRELTRTGWQATGVTLSESSAEALNQEGLQVLAADLRTSDLQALTKNKPAVIVHCASSGKAGAAAYREIFFETPKHLIKEASFEHLIFTSSTSVYAQTDGSIVAETDLAEPERETAKILRETQEIVLARPEPALRFPRISDPARSIPSHNPPPPHQRI